ncbi:MAG TPA: hypothetical protein VGJ74_22295 [Burkholderiales bacterium]|jgi:hypothetical protein
MRLSFPLAVVLALLANLIPVFNRQAATSAQETSNPPLPPQTHE